MTGLKSFALAFALFATPTLSYAADCGCEKCACKDCACDGSSCDKKDGKCSCEKCADKCPCHKKEKK